MNKTLPHILAEHGVPPARDLLPANSGEIQRFQTVDDKHGKLSGWVVSYHNDLSSTVHVFGSWKTGETHTVAEGESAHSKREMRQLIEQAQRQAKIQKAREQREVAESCAKLWESLPAAEIHPYLIAKAIKPHVARCWRDSLVIPLVGFDMRLASLQFIKPNGSKIFRKGGKISGAFCPLGKLEVSNQSSFVICEGYATGASIYEATGLPVLVAFNANNLASVVSSLRRRAPAAKIIIAADNDRFTSVGNVGVEKAEAAARNAGAFVIVPQFETDKGTDFNDLAQQKGLHAIQTVFMEVAA